MYVGAAPITNGMATVIVDGLECEVTYTITAGGTLDGDLVGPRSSHGNITTGPCPVITTTTTTTLLSTYVATYVHVIYYTNIFLIMLLTHVRMYNS